MSSQRRAKQELGRYVWERFERYREGRRPHEARWEEAYYNTLGEYAPHVQGQWRAHEATGSRVFVRLTRQKVREACRRIEPALRSIRFDLVSSDGQQGGMGEMKSEFERILALAKTSDHLVSMVWDAAWSGTGILRAPVLAEAAETVYSHDPETDLWATLPAAEPFPAVETVCIWEFYPDPDAPSLEEAEGVIQLHRVYPHQLRRMIHRAGWDGEAVARLAERGDSATNPQMEQWEQSIRAAVSQSCGADTGGDKLRLLEYWGNVPAELLRSAGVELPPGCGEDVEATLVVGGGELLKAGVNPWTPAYRPYLRFRWEPVPHQFWGVGIAENIRDAQKMINGASRLLVDNKALAGNCMFEIDVEALVPGQDVSKVYPGKKWVLRPGARGPAIRPVTVPDVSSMLLEMIQLFQSYADTSSGVADHVELPSGVGRTATGMAMALSASADGFRTIVRRLDDEVVEPLVERIYRWLMEYGDPSLPKGPARVRAVSTASSQAKELRSARLMDFLELVTGRLSMLPVDPANINGTGVTLAARVDVEKLLEELADALDVREILRPETITETSLAETGEPA